MGYKYKYEKERAHIQKKIKRHIPLQEQIRLDGLPPSDLQNDGKIWTVERTRGSRTVRSPERRKDLDGGANRGSHTVRSPERRKDLDGGANPRLSHRPMLKPRRSDDEKSVVSWRSGCCALIGPKKTTPIIYNDAKTPCLANTSSFLFFLRLQRNFLHFPSVDRSIDRVIERSHRCREPAEILA